LPTRRNSMTEDRISNLRCCGWRCASQYDIGMFPDVRHTPQATHIVKSDRKRRAMQNQNVYFLVDQHRRLALSQLLDESPIAWRQGWSEDAADTLPKPFFRHTKLDTVFGANPSSVERIGLLLVILFFIRRPGGCGCGGCKCFWLGCCTSCFRGLWFQLERC
jgi:hypothetical protein